MNYSCVELSFLSVSAGFRRSAGRPLRTGKRLVGALDRSGPEPDRRTPGVHPGIPSRAGEAGWSHSDSSLPPPKEGPGLCRQPIARHKTILPDKCQPWGIDSLALYRLASIGTFTIPERTFATAPCPDVSRARTFSSLTASAGARQAWERHGYSIFFLMASNWATNRWASSPSSARWGLPPPTITTLDGPAESGMIVTNRSLSRSINSGSAAVPMLILSPTQGSDPAADFVTGG